MDDASTVFSYDSVSEERCDAEKLALAEQIIGLVENRQMNVNDISPAMEHCIDIVLRRRRLQTEAQQADDLSTIPDAYPEADDSSTASTSFLDALEQELSGGGDIPDSYPEADESSIGGDTPAFPDPEPQMATLEEEDFTDMDYNTAKAYGYEWEYGVPGPDQMLSSIDDAYEGEGLDEIVHWDDTLGRWVLLEDENYTVIGEMNESGEPVYYGDF